ncbi:MAG: hypothetical protein GF364_21360 [Candidatus Lokiarchaeota archaeon]|nr:hypothetical protein [Candidatus Lokiarchaeota archaeon]
MSESAEKEENIVNSQKLSQISFILCIVSVVGWIIMFIVALDYMISNADNINSRFFVWFIGLIYISSGILGCYFLKKDKKKTGGLIIFLGYLSATSTMVILLFPLFIPPFDWYVYFMISILLIGLIGSNISINECRVVKL